MTKDLPDFQLEVVTAAVEATAFRSGLDADKPASPAAGDIWLARDTFYLYVCFVAGSWEKAAKLYLPLAGGTMTGAIAMGTKKITGMGDPTAAQDAATRAYVLAQVANYLALAGGTMAGAIAMGTNKITGMGDPTAAQDAATRAYADTKLANVVEDTTPQLGGELDAQSNKIVSLGAPTAAADAARKTDVDTVDAKFDDVSHAEPTRVLNTVYQNTGGKIRLVSVSVVAAGGAGFEQVRAYCDANATPTTIVTHSSVDEDTADMGSVFFVVPPSYYYYVENGNLELLDWHEWDLH